MTPPETCKVPTSFVVPAFPTAPRYIRIHSNFTGPISNGQGRPGFGINDRMRAVVEMALDSGFPVATVWGEDAIQIYNDAYNPIYGHKHPGGSPASAGGRGPLGDANGDGENDVADGAGKAVSYK